MMGVTAWWSRLMDAILLRNILEQNAEFPEAHAQLWNLSQ
jgi:endonuclease III-like uncharacterized protein